MTDEEKGVLEFDLENTFYYLNYPDPVPAGKWKDGHGEYIAMAGMPIEHLNACIKLIEKDIKNLQGRPDAVVDALVPMARTKQTELTNMLDKKIADLRR